MTTETDERFIPKADSFGKRLAFLRIELGLTQAEAAHLCGVKKPTWTYWEAHPTRSPRDLINVVNRISDTLRVDRDWLMWGTSTDDTSIRWNLDSPPLTSGNAPCLGEGSQPFSEEQKAA